MLKSADAITCLTTFIEWFFYASSPIQTEKTLADQNTLLSRFNELKWPFVEVSPSSLNFPKLHSLIHIAESTRRFGTPDNFDTETTEHQHRVEVKVPYQRTNKRNPLSQIVKFVERRTAFEDKLEHIHKSANISKPPITDKYRHLSSLIPEGAIDINMAADLFKIGALKLAIQTFFHDLELASVGKQGYRNRVSKKNLPKLTNQLVSSTLIR